MKEKSHTTQMSSLYPDIEAEMATVQLVQVSPGQTVAPGVVVQAMPVATEYHINYREQWSSGYCDWCAPLPSRSSLRPQHPGVSGAKVIAVSSECFRVLLTVAV